jgi:hypothetical protein
LVERPFVTVAPALEERGDFRSGQSVDQRTTPGRFGSGGV